MPPMQASKATLCPCLTLVHGRIYCSEACKSREERKAYAFQHLSREKQNQTLGTHINLVDEPRFEEGDIL